MIHNFETGFRDGMEILYYDYEPNKLTMRTTNYLIKVEFKTPLTREWLTKMLGVDLSRITEFEFTVYVKDLLHHIYRDSSCEVIPKYDNKITK